VDPIYLAIRRIRETPTLQHLWLFVSSVQFLRPYALPCGT
jgi:hypothetical protein